jgi:hypothetical protein
MSTASEAALHICLSVSRFRDLVAEGVFKRMPPGKYSLKVIRETYCRHAQKRMAGRAADGGENLSMQRAKLASVQTARLEFEAARETGSICAPGRDEAAAHPFVRRVPRAVLGDARQVG